MGYPHPSHPKETVVLSRYFGDPEARSYDGWVKRGGYEALREICGVFVDPDGSGLLTQFAAEHTGRKEVPERLAGGERIALHDVGGRDERAHQREGRGGAERSA